MTSYKLSPSRPLPHGSPDEFSIHRDAIRCRDEFHLGQIEAVRRLTRLWARYDANDVKRVVRETYSREEKAVWASREQATS